MIKIAVGSDRRGFSYKIEVIQYLTEHGCEVVDVGPYDGMVPVDYPIYGEKVGKLVSSGKCRYGVAICATGTGIMISANKVRGIRCGIAYTDDAVRLMREHNDANVIAFGQSQMSLDDVFRRLDIFLRTDFLGDYHVSRVQQIQNIENGIPISQTPVNKIF